MTEIDYILPMKKTRRIFLVIYDGFELLDMSGPASVFSAANKVAGQDYYQVEILSRAGVSIASGAGVRVDSKPLTQFPLSRRDTVLVMGAEGPSLKPAMADPAIRSHLTTAAKTVSRYGSICSGALILAAAGLLDGRRATTHWAACQDMAHSYPKISLDPEALYITEDRLWTSAGVTTGIDMALAMVAQDHGTTLMGQIAKYLIIYAHRPGNQSQFSALLEAQVAAGGVFATLITWIADHLDQPLRVEDLAAKVAMSERTFYRKFTKKMGMTPSKFIEHTRLERAKHLLENNMPIKAVVAAIGFRSAAGFRHAFEARYGILPSLHRQLHADR